MKLPSGMLGDSWMGSDFTNDDLVKGNSISRDFDAAVEAVVEHEGRPAWQVVLKPKRGAPVVWGKVELLVDRASCVPLSQRFFDEDGVLARRMTFSELKQVGWRTFPMRLTMWPAEEGRQTTLTYQSIEFDPDIPDDTFSVHRLQQGR